MMDAELHFDVFEGITHNVWIVEGINHAGEGEIYWAEFYGSDAEERAKEYAAWMNSKSAAQQLHHQHSLTAL